MAALKDQFKLTVLSYGAGTSRPNNHMNINKLDDELVLTALAVVPLWLLPAEFETSIVSNSMVLNVLLPLATLSQAKVGTIKTQKALPFLSIGRSVGCFNRCLGVQPRPKFYTLSHRVPMLLHML